MSQSNSPNRAICGRCGYPAKEGLSPDKPCPVCGATSTQGIPLPLVPLRGPGRMPLLFAGGAAIGLIALLGVFLVCITTLSVAGVLPTPTPTAVVAKANVQAFPTSTAVVTFPPEQTNTNQPTPTPRPTETPSPSDTLVPTATVQPSSTLVPTNAPRATPFLTPVNGLGFSRTVLQSYFEGKGFVFLDPDTSLGEPHIHGDSSNGESIDLTGSPDNLVSVELDLPDNEKSNSAPLLDLLALVAPDWKDGVNWVQANQAVGVKNATAGNPLDIEDTTFRNLNISLLTYDILGVKFGIDDAAWLHAVAARITLTPLASPLPAVVTPIASAPTTTPASALSITVVSLTSPASRNSNATLAIHTSPGAACSIIVNYKSGPSGAPGLGPTTADANGRCAWTWKVGGNATPGMWSISVTVSLNGQKNSISIPFQVQ